MLITFLRSSSYNTFDFCQHKYFLEYTLGHTGRANKKAIKGSIVHKALELLAKKKLAIQNNQIFFTDDTFGEYPVDGMSINLAIVLSYSYYVLRSPHCSWDQSDEDDCSKWVYDVINNSMFSPLNVEVVEPEKYFDFVIEKPWAWYNQVVPQTGEEISGYFGLKGTLDLIVRRHDGLELIDWKTNASMVDWATGKDKTYTKLSDDPQLRLYHYALHHIYPDINNIYITIYYIRAGGPLTISLTKEDLPSTEKMLEKRFNLIMNTVRPKLIYPDWKCNRLCPFSQVGTTLEKVDYYSQSICKITSEEIIQLGINEVTRMYGKQGSYNSYGEGGGKTHK